MPYSRRIGTAFRTALLALAIAAVEAAAATIVLEGQANAVIVIPASERNPADRIARETQNMVEEAARDLSVYIAKASGATLPVVRENELSSSGAVTMIFVGACEASKRAVDASTLQPEGFIIKVAGSNVYIVGRDRTDSGHVVRGTEYGCTTFLEKFLGIRWLMPGELGEVIPPTRTLAIADTEIREEPLLWLRSFRNSVNTHLDRAEAALKLWQVPIPAWKDKFTRNAPDWFQRQRLGRRVKVLYGHAYSGWWDKYQAKHPEIFALQPNGTRDVGNVREKLCVSNPILWDLVAAEKIRELKADPLLLAASISPNDGTSRSVHCVCQNCRAWDAREKRLVVDNDPDSPAKAPEENLTDRYFRFYNEVAKRVVKEMPDRLLGCYAYSIYRQPPIDLKQLEPNLLVGYVGFESYLSEKRLADDRREWSQWGTLAKQMFFRPNLLWTDRGFPLNYVRRHAADLRVMVASGMRAADYDGMVGNWGATGLGYYAITRLLWNVNTDVDALIDDYCRAAYGAGAGAMKAYYARLEALTDQIAREEKYDVSRGQRDMLDGLVAYYTDDLLAELRTFTQDALRALGETDMKAAARVQLVAESFDYVRSVRDVVQAAAAVREGRFSRPEYASVLAAANRQFGALAMSWSVSTPHNYPYILRALRLK
jgi:hypothetical protein